MIIVIGSEVLAFASDFDNHSMTKNDHVTD